MRSAGLILLVWAAGCGAAAQFAKASLAWEAIAARYAGAPPAGLGLVVSVVGLVGLLFGALAGPVLARIGPRRALVAALVLGAGASAAQAALPALPLMLALRVAEGVSHLAVVVAGPVLIAGLAGERYRGLAMALWSSFFGLTYAVLALLAPPLLARAGVAGLFLGHAAWLAVLALVLARALPPDPAPPPVAPQRGLLALHAGIYRDPRVAAPALGFVWYTASFVALLTLLPPLMPADWRDPVATALPLVSIATSLSLGVWAVGRWEPDRVVQAGHALTALGALGFWVAMGQGAPMAAAVVLIGVGAGLAQGASFAAIPALNPDPADRARAAGAIAQMGNLGTVTGTPLLAALLAGLGPAAIAAFVLPLSAAGVLVIGVLRRLRG